MPQIKFHNGTTILLPFDPLIGCDGKPHSDDFLQDKLETAIAEEAYEDAQVYSDELIRRGVIEKKVSRDLPSL